MLTNKMIQPKENIQRNLEQVRTRIFQSASRVGRDPQEIRLVVVTKTHPVPVIEALREAGVKWIGESYVEEALPKIAALGKGSGLEWHMIGHVQSRKAQSVCTYFQYVHSLDSLKLAGLLNRFAGNLAITLPVLLECNVSGEKNKYGWPAWDEEKWPELVPPIAQILSMSNLVVRGLMTVAPYDIVPARARPYFLRLSKLRTFLSAEFPHARLDELSMGMSGDFEVAVEEGATIVRIGQAILGPRGTAN
jgi:pyridoxal phosphate enzyme (YggS family)